MKEEIIRIVKSRCALEEEVTEESVFKELSLDSLSFVEIVVEIETETGIEFELEELNMENWSTVGELILVVEEKRNEEQKL